MSSGHIELGSHLPQTSNEAPMRVSPKIRSAVAFGKWCHFFGEGPVDLAAVGAFPSFFGGSSSPACARCGFCPRPENGTNLKHAIAHERGMCNLSMGLSPDGTAQVCRSTPPAWQTGLLGSRQLSPEDQPQLLKLDE